ncbi:kinase-like domain-containing protein [Pisolithus croceorrhizus]|nr:kinase-like domain-containing protein [Pisolithus croceorrhizus]KAI6114617.1 kinase-like domain-containing protein [Pisolithus croceorrhizus]KAI6146604.1 kinase-like domain-containing protein [Pisolithus thermaeus]
MNTPEGTRKWLFYTFVGALADALDTILTFVVPEKTSERIHSSDVDELSDDAILALRRTAPRLHPDYCVFKVSPTTVAKSTDMEEDAIDCTEANAMQLVFEKTTIPVPRVHRVVKGSQDFLIVMDYIKGQTLAQVWPTFSVWRKFSVAFTLRRYIRQLRRLKASPTTPPGPLSAQGPQICESPIFGQVQSRRGPFSSYSELSTFFNERCKMGLDGQGAPEDHPSRKMKFDDSGPLVLTHQDINLRNIILGDDGRLWIIDWGWSGYYPPWFEFVATERQAELPVVSGTDDDLWKKLAPFICGPYFTQKRWLENMSLGLYVV